MAGEIYTSGEFGFVQFSDASILKHENRSRSLLWHHGDEWREIDIVVLKIGREESEGDRLALRLA